MSFCYLTIEELLKMNRSQSIMFSKKDISSDISKRIQEIILDLKAQIPIQYILGFSDFFGMKFKVNKNTLIPRPETEELVSWIIEDNINQKKSYLDIGTGSGCIIISLSKKLHGSFSAIDISKKALNVAKENAKSNDSKVNFHIKDLFDTDLNMNKYDIIVSNPPYVLEEEKHMIAGNVLNEPHLALFVDSQNPLIFYERITDIARQHLNKEGSLYFEINENYSAQIISILHKARFVNIQLKKDINRKDRMIKAVLK